MSKKSSLYDDPSGSRVNSIINEYITEKRHVTAVSRGFNVVRWIREFYVGMRFSCQYVTNDVCKRCSLFCVGFVTLAFVVFVITILRNSFRKAPFVILTVSEGTTGEADIYMLPRFTNDSQNPLLNFTEISSKLEDEPLMVGVAPRWMFLGYIKTEENPTSKFSGTILITDTEEEVRMGLGRSFPFRDLGKLEAHIAKPILSACGVKPQHGERLLVELNIDSFVDALLGTSLSLEGGVAPDSTGLGALNLNGSTQLTNIARNAGFDPNEKVVINVTTLPLDQLGLPPLVLLLLEQMGSIELNITYGEIIGAVEEQTGFTTIQDVIDSIDLSVEVAVVDEMDDYYGKYPDAFGNLIIMDSKYMDSMFQQLLARNPTLTLLLNTVLGGTGSATNFLNGETPTTEDVTSLGASVLASLTGLEGLGELANPSEFDVTQMIKEFDWNSYALMIVGMYSNRFETYIKDSKERRHEMIQFTNRIMDKIGVRSPLTFQTPVETGLSVMDYIVLFLEQIFVGMTIIMVALGGILLYSLLIQNVDEKTYEYGMLRALGLLQPTLVQMIFVQVVYFSLPGILVGLIIAVIINIPVDYIFFWSCTLESMDFTFTWDAIVLPISLGIIIPAVANIVPIRKALGKSLRDSLDIARQTLSETKVRFIKLERMGLQAWQTTASVVMIVMGFVVYYILPLAFILQELSIFFYVLEFIFIAMLVGLCLLAVVLEPILERLIVTMILYLVTCIFPRDKRMRTLILKNLAGHRGRNRKAFLMFTITIAFLIFAGANFNMLIKTIVGNIVVFMGADVVAMSTTLSYNVRNAGLVNFLDTQMKAGNVSSYTFQTFSMSSYGFIDATRFSNIAGYPSSGVSVYGLEENFLEPTFEEYYIPTEKNRAIRCFEEYTSSCDFVMSLYQDEGRAHVEGLRSNYRPLFLQTGVDLDVSESEYYNYDPGKVYQNNYDIIMSEAMRDYYGVDSETPVLLQLRKFTGEYSKFVAIPHGMVRKFPGFFFSSYSISARGSPVMMSVRQFEEIVNQTYSEVVQRSIDRDEPLLSKHKYSGSINYQKVYVKIGNDNDEDTRIFVTNGLRVHIDPDFSMVQDTEEIKDSASGATIGFTSLFYLLGLIALVFCTYMLFLSFVGNVRDNQWVFGVLRATGFPVNMLIRAYIYEALSLVIAAFCLGLIIGIVIASTLILQFNLFIEMPFQFHFPYDMVSSMGVLAVLLAVLGSYFPARRIKKREIAQVLRGLE